LSKVIDLLNQFKDPRDPKKISHPLATLLFIFICAIFSGAEGWEDMVLWGEANIDWLSKYVDMSNGMPSYSTLRRMFQLILPACWGNMIRESIDNFNPNKKAEDHVPIDGKSLRGSKCISKGVRAMQMVSAFSIENEIILGEVKTNSKSNEAIAIPLLLDLLDLEGSTISIDAIGCNKKIIAKILEKGSHYMIGLKKNQPKLFSAIESYSQEHGIHAGNLIEDHFDDSHGRNVRRRYFSFEIPEQVKPLIFGEMKTVVASETISYSKYTGGSSSEWRYYLTDHDKSRKNLDSYVRGHWQVESMHWCLDVHLNDDRDKKYDGNAAENYAKTKRFLFNLVKLKPPKGKKRSFRSNLKLVGWDLGYLTRLLFG
jgi:predicted transposase YbfD/YdcC